MNSSDGVPAPGPHQKTHEPASLAPMGVVRVHAPGDRAGAGHVPAWQTPCGAPADSTLPDAEGCLSSTPRGDPLSSFARVRRSRCGSSDSRHRAMATRDSGERASTSIGVSQRTDPKSALSGTKPPVHLAAALLCRWRVTVALNDPPITSPLILPPSRVRVPVNLGWRIIRAGSEIVTKGPGVEGRSRGGHRWPATRLRERPLVVPGEPTRTCP